MNTRVVFPAFVAVPAGKEGLNNWRAARRDRQTDRQTDRERVNRITGRRWSVFPRIPMRGLPNDGQGPHSLVPFFLLLLNPNWFASRHSGLFPPPPHFSVFSVSAESHNRKFSFFSPRPDAVQQHLNVITFC